MKITDLKMIHLRPRWMFLKIETDEGITGWGEPVVEGRARTVETAVNEFRPILIGADPMKIEHLWQMMYRGTFIAAALSYVARYQESRWHCGISRANIIICRYTRCLVDPAGTESGYMDI